MQRASAFTPGRAPMPYILLLCYTPTQTFYNGVAVKRGGLFLEALITRALISVVESNTAMASPRRV